MSPSQIFCGNVHVISLSGANPVRNNSSAGRPAIRIVFSNPTAVAELNVKDVMSICAARMKQNNDHRIGSKNTPTAPAEKTPPPRTPRTALEPPAALHPAWEPASAYNLDQPATNSGTP